MLASMASRRIAVEPDTQRAPALRQAVLDAGGTLCDASEAEGLIWTRYSQPDRLADLLDQSPNLSWVSLPYTGIEPYVPHLDHKRVWTCARGIYSQPVAEMAIAMGLAGMRGLVGYAQQTSWTKRVGHNLLGGQVTIFGAGGIASEIIRQLQGFDCEITVVRNRAVDMDGADRTLTFEDRHQGLPNADLVIVALALTPMTKGIIGSIEFDTMKSTAWLVNVGRGPHIVTDELVEALQTNQIGGACLDVTNPEPLPDDHPLWTIPNALITPHTGNTPEMGLPLLVNHVKRNVELFCAQKTLEGIINIEAGY